MTSRKQQSPPPTPLPQLLDHFATWLRNNDRADYTVTSYLQTLRQFAGWFKQANGTMLMSENLTPSDIKQYREDLIKQGYKPASTNRNLAALRAFGAWIAETQHITDPAIKIKLISINRLELNSRPKGLNKQELFKLQQTLEQRLAYAERRGHQLAWVYRNQAIVMTLLHTGLRVGELCALTLDDLTLHPRSGKLVIRRGKGMKYREMPLNAPVREALATWLKYRASIAGTKSKALFITKYRGGIYPDGVQHLLHELANDTNIKITPHTLRHTFGKALADAGITLEQVAALMGHSSLETTRIYTTPTAQDLTIAVTKLEN